MMDYSNSISQSGQTCREHLVAGKCGAKGSYRLAGRTCIRRMPHMKLVKMLVPIVVACAVWGPQWHQFSALIHCNNESAVKVVNLGHSKVEKIMYFLQFILYSGPI